MDRRRGRPDGRCPEVNPTTAPGTVDFAVNSKYLGTVTVKSGSATLQWVPNALGTFTLTATYSGDGGVSGGTATNKVTVVAQLKVDQIVVDPAGTAGPLVPGVTTTLQNGASVQLNATAASGQAVKLTVVGPCTLTGNVLQVKGVGGACALTASTAGGNAYAPATVRYSVQTGIGAQTARVIAPPSGRYDKGRRLFLGKLTRVTNVNQPVRWHVSRGKSNCRVVAVGKYYRLKLVSRGMCTVKGSAPAISNQWSAYSAFRKYSVR